MSDPLLARERLDAAEAPWLLALRLSAQGVRETPEHAHARGQLFGARRGLLSVGTDRGVWLVPASDAVWVPPQRPHSLRSHGPAFDGWSVYVAPAECAALPSEPCALTVSALLRAAVERAAQWPADTAWPPAQDRLARVLLDEIALAAAGAGPDRLGLPMPHDPRLLRVARALADRPADPRGLAAWAEVAHLSERSLTRRFAAQTGYSLVQWRQRARLLRALERLAAGEAVTAVALELGYDSVSAFAAMFRRHLGASPSQYLRGLQGD